MEGRQTDAGRDASLACCIKGIEELWWFTRILPSGRFIFFAFGNDSQTHSSVEQEIFLSMESVRKSQRSPHPPSPFPLLVAGLTQVCLDRQASFLFSKAFPREAVRLPGPLSRSWKPFSHGYVSLRTNCLMIALLKLKAGVSLRARERNRTLDSGTRTELRWVSRDSLRWRPELTASSHRVPW